MVIRLSPELESALKESARQQGIMPEILAVNVLRERLLPGIGRFTPQDEWERRLLSLGTDCGVSLPDSALTSEELYE